MYFLKVKFNKINGVTLTRTINDIFVKSKFLLYWSLFFIEFEDYLMSFYFDCKLKHV